jgi:cytochrome c peroxidase
MKPKVYYANVKDALDKLKEEGYTTDFNLEENCIACHAGKFNHDEFEITAIYRYEGDSNPDDESTVYAIESKSGLKGVLVTSYGAYSENLSDEILKKLKG